MAFDAIDTTELDELLASSRERGVYEREARLFIEGGEQAGKVNLENGTFKGKSAATVAAGFRGTVSKNFADTLRVISNDNGVYLVNTSL